MKINSIKKKLGQNTVEYVILAVLLAVGTIGAFKFLGGAVKSQVQTISSAISGTDKIVAPSTETATGMNLEASDLEASTASED